MSRNIIFVWTFRLFFKEQWHKMDYPIVPVAYTEDQPSECDVYSGCVHQLGRKFKPAQWIKCSVRCVKVFGSNLYFTSCQGLCLLEQTEFLRSGIGITRSYIYIVMQKLYILWYVGLPLCGCMLLHYWICIGVELLTSIGSSKLRLKASLLQDGNQNY